MYLTYIRRELRRRLKQSLVIALGLALGIALVITVSSASAGVPPPMQQYQAPPGGYTTGLTPKNPAISLLISFIVPGVGTIINGETGKGIAILVAYIVSLFLIIVLVGILLAPAVWIYGMYDAYQGAKKFNLAHGFPPGG